MRRLLRLRNLFLLLFVAALAYCGSQLAFARRQADPDYRTFRAGRATLVRLDAGESVNVYLTAGESEPMTFDFYPSDLTCDARGDLGNEIAGSSISHERRMVDGRNSFWGVESLEAEVEDSYRLQCMDRAGRHYPLVLARPSTSPVGPAHPVLGFSLVVLTAMPLAASLLNAAYKKREAEAPDRR